MHAEGKNAELSNEIPVAPTRRIHKSNYRRAATIIRHFVPLWCLEHPDYSLSKRGPGERETSSIAPTHFFINDSMVFERAQNGLCLISAIVNAFSWALWGRYGI